MRRIMYAAIVAFTILTSVVLPFGGVKEAYAIDGKTVLNAADGGDFCSSGAYCSPAQNLNLTQIGDTTTKVSQYSDAVVLQLNVIIGRDGSSFVAKDQPTGLTGSGVLDWNDLKDSAWDGFYNDDNFAGAMAGGGDRDNGFFLQVSKGKSLKADVDNKPLSAEILDDASNISNFQVRHPDMAPSDQGSLYSLARKTSSPGDNSAVELLKIFAEHTDKFFNKDSFNPVIAITNLEPNTKYFFQIVAEEDNSTNWFFSNVVEVTTKADGAENKFGVAPVDDAIKEALGQPPAQSGQDTFVASLECSILNGKISGCFVILFNDIFVSTAHWVAQQSGRLFDAFANVSLGSTIYGQGTKGADIASFVENGWSVVRDIANIFFIFILLYAALSLVLSLHLHGTSVKKIVSQVIIIALLINFSLFFCRVTIDASNMLSRVFYNAMDISTVGNTPTTNDSTGPKEKSISAAVIGGIQPQKLLSQESLDKLKSNGTPVTDGTIFMVLLISFILNIILAWIFFMCAAFFAGRIGVIWFSMIFAPLAFVTSIVPGLDHSLKQLGWGEWLKTFLSACFKAPVFFFFLYLIVNLVGGPGGGLLGSTLGAITDAQNGNWVSFLVGILLPTMIVIGLLMEAKKQAESMAGQFGGAFAGIVAAGAGMAAMVGTGGAAIVGRSTVGALASKISNPESAFGNKMRDIAAGKATTGLGSTALGKWTAKQGVRATNAGKSASFDARNTGIANSLSKVTGVDMNVGAKIPLANKLVSSFSTENTAGGFEGKVARQAEKDRKFADMLGYDKREHDAVGKTIEDREEKISKQEDIVQALQGFAQQAKASGAPISYTNPVTGVTETKSAADIQSQVNSAQETLRIMKKGGDKTNPAHVWSAADVASGAKKADGTAVTTNDVGQLKTDYIGLEKLKKAQENIKTSRAKEYYNNRIIKSGAYIDPHHGTEKRDALGNITKLAHADQSNDWGRVGRNIAKNFAGAFAGGALVGSVAGPMGSLAVGGAWGLARAIQTGFEDGLGQMRHEVAHLASDSSHAIHKGHSTYKSPTSGFTDMFKGLSGGGGGGGHGGGHDDHGHGGGHDDHGGGGHH